MELIALVVRWLHILAATVTVGTPIFIRFVVLPALAKDASYTREREAIAARWRMLIYVSMAVFLATGLWNYLGVARWREFDPAIQGRYHMLLGIKLLLALGLFFVLSALAGRSAKLAFIRDNAKTWFTLALSLGIMIVALSGCLRQFQKPAAAGQPGAQRLAVSALHER